MWVGWWVGLVTCHALTSEPFSRYLWCCGLTFVQAALKRAEEATAAAASKAEAAAAEVASLRAAADAQVACRALSNLSRPPI